MTSRPIFARQGRRSVGFRKAVPVLTAAVVAAALGCRRAPPKPEVLLRKSLKVRPYWVRKTPPPANGYEFFVGRSVAVNILDERRALEKARENAAHEIASTIVTEVRGSATLVDNQYGDEARGGEALDTYWNSQITVLTNQILAGVRVVESYWELWQVVDRVPEGKLRKFRRYKYYVLVRFPADELERCREQVKKNMRSNSIGSSSRRKTRRGKAALSKR